MPPFDPNLLRSRAPFFFAQSLQDQVSQLQADVAALAASMGGDGVTVFEVAISAPATGSGSAAFPFTASGGNLVGATLNGDNSVTLPDGRYLWYLSGSGLFEAGDTWNCTLQIGDPSDSSQSVIGESGVGTGEMRLQNDGDNPTRLTIAASIAFLMPQVGAPGQDVFLFADSSDPVWQSGFKMGFAKLS